MSAQMILVVAFAMLAMAAAFAPTGRGKCSFFPCFGCFSVCYFASVVLYQAAS
jgi:hypothetical protein